MTQVIQINDLSFSYDEDLVLDHIHLSIEAGEFIGIIGPNGGGKTTFLKIVMGLLKPSSGVVKVFGLPPKLSRTKIAYVPQVSRCDRYFPISVRELVLSGRLSALSWWQRYRLIDKEAADEAIERVGLSAFRDRPFGTLSGGQAQRALIARALASHTDLLLLDEPTANIDVHAEMEILKLLEEMKGSITMVMVTHNLKAVGSQVDRVYCFQRHVTALNPKQLCEHFALGLYHPPLSNSSYGEPS